MAEDATRRGFLKAINLTLAGMIGAVFSVPFVRFLLFPVRRRTVTGLDGPISVTSEASLPAAGGPPLRVELVSRAQRDAWAVLDNVAQGAAWIVRGPDGRPKALSTTCPHLGCAVDYDVAAQVFRCPCHTSSFDLQGRRISGPAPRDMDALAIEVRDGQVLLDPGKGV